MQSVKDSSDFCLNSKFSSAQKGYFEDEFMRLFIDKLHPRSPMINRGYYIRFRAIEEVFQSWWLSVNRTIFENFQIISLGAGYDASYLRLKNAKKLPPNCHYVEIDFPEVMKKKYELIGKAVTPKEDSVDRPGVVLYSDDYSMLGIDVTDIPALQKCFSCINIGYDVPTLFLSECSLTYIDIMHSDALIKWIQSHFPHSVFAAYEQVYPLDAFGMIMKNHFTEVGCPLKSILTYPDEESLLQRFKKLGWPECDVLSMYNLFQSFSSVEKCRVQYLEMFDEYEMWHEKCHHYILAWVAQGALTQCLESLQTIKPAVDITQCKILEKPLQLRFLPVDDVLERFGHQAIPMSSNIIMVSGGFGKIKNKHQQLEDMVLYDIKSNECMPVSLGEQPLMGKRMYHSMVKLPGNKVIIIGGRRSPKQPFRNVLILQNSHSDEIKDLNQDFTPVLRTSDVQMPIPTFRHSASAVVINGMDSVVVFGGYCCMATNNCFILSSRLWMWSPVGVQKHTPSPRQSHSSVTYNTSNVIITGGLNGDDHIFNSVHKFDAEKRKWDVMDVIGLLPRYSHTSHIWNDHLFLVGGVTSIGNTKLGIGVVNLKTLQAFEVGLPAQDPEFPILLCGHTSYIDEDDIFIIGGGGNCFSFGTHFNKRIAVFNVKQLVA